MSKVTAIREMVKPTLPPLKSVQLEVSLEQAQLIYLVLGFVAGGSKISLNQLYNQLGEVEEVYFGGITRIEQLRRGGGAPYIDVQGVHFGVRK
jgi:hypothetical protein